MSATPITGRTLTIPTIRFPTGSTVGSAVSDVLPTKFLHGRAGPVARKRNGRAAIGCAVVRHIVPVSGLTLAPWRLRQVAGRSSGQDPYATLNVFEAFAQDG